MRIVDIRETTAKLDSSMRNAVIDNGFTAPPDSPGLGVEQETALFETVAPLGEV